MKIIQKFLSALVSAAFVFVIIFAVVYLVAPKYVVRIFGFEINRVISNSMEPKILVNDIVIATDVHNDTVVSVDIGANDLAEGDIIVFNTYINNEKAKVTHYFSHIDNQGYVHTYRIDGSDNKLADRWFRDGVEHKIAISDVVGKVIYVLPTSTLINFFFSGYGIMSLPSLILSIFFFSMFLKELNNEQELGVAFE